MPARDTPHGVNADVIFVRPAGEPGLFIATLGVHTHTSKRQVPIRYKEDLEPLYAEWKTAATNGADQLPWRRLPPVDGLDYPEWADAEIYKDARWQHVRSLIALNMIAPEVDEPMLTAGWEAQLRSVLVMYQMVSSEKLSDALTRATRLLAMVTAVLALATVGLIVVTAVA